MLTTEQIDKLKEAFAAGCKRGEACKVAGVSGEDFSAFQRENEAEVQSWIDGSEEQLIAMAKMAVYRKVKRASVDDTPNAKDDADTARFVLERRAKKEYSNRTELTGEEGGAIKVERLIMDI